MKQIDKIKQMNAEEMAENLAYYFEKEVSNFTYPCKFCLAKMYCNRVTTRCEDAYLEWLESEVEE